MRIKNFFLLLFCLVVFVQCNDNEEYFNEPGWLEKPVYQILKDEGRFTSYLQLIDRTSYAPVLRSGGMYTVFAPNDEAFSVFLLEKGYNSVDDISQVEANTIVAYSMVFSNWKLSNLGDYFRGTVDYEYMPGNSFKKKTSYYPSIYQDPDNNNNWTYDQNAVGSLLFTSNTGAFVPSYKYLPVFMASYFNQAGLTAEDYNTFFPEVPFTGKNLYKGQIIVNEDHPEGIVARNGMVQEVDVVNYPLDNMDKVLHDNQYRVFKNEFLGYKTVTGSYAFIDYWEAPSIINEYYKKIYPEANIQKVDGKIYNPAIAFSPAYELNGQPATEELTGFTLFVPTNEVLTRYINDKLLKYYDDIKEVPMEAILALINVHMSEGLVWPSNFKNAKVHTDEYLNGLGPTGGGYDEMEVVDQKYTSNGIIYSINKVIKSSLFETAYAEVYLNPAYSMLNSAFVNYFATTALQDLRKSIISGYEHERYTLIMPSDNLLKEDGYAYDDFAATFSNELILSGTAEDRLRRLVRMHIFQGYKGNGIDTEVSFEGDGPSQYNGWGFRTSYYGDIIRFKDNKLQATGNFEDGTYVTVKPVETYDNGTVYTMEYETSSREMLQFSPRKTYPSEESGWTSGTLWKHISKAGVDNRNVTDFVEYVRVALKGTESDELAGISEEGFYTILMINNTSMNNARRDGLLPALLDLNAEMDTLTDGPLKIKASQFLRSHFLQGKVYPDDGLSYLFPYNATGTGFEEVSTMYRITEESLGLVNRRTNVYVSKTTSGALSFVPQNVLDESKTVILVNGNAGRTVSVTRGAVAVAQPDNFRSNRMAGRAVLHEVNGFFGYELKQNP